MKRIRLDLWVITLVEWFIDILKFAAPALANGLLYNRVVFNSVLLFLTAIVIPTRLKTIARWP